MQPLEELKDRGRFRLQNTFMINLPRESKTATEIVAWWTSMPIYFSWLITALLSVGGDTNNHNLQQSGRLLYCVTRPVHVNAQRRSTLLRLVCDRWNPVTLLANQVERHAYPESVQFASSPELRFTVRESQSQGFGASLDVREGRMLPTTLLPGA